MPPASAHTGVKHSHPASTSAARAGVPASSAGHPGVELDACSHGSAWSDDEIALFGEAWDAGGYKAVQRVLPHRTKGAIFHRAARMGLRRRRRWTKAADTELRDLWSFGTPLTTIARRLGRTKATTYWRAQKLGLPLGVPGDFEHLTTAGRRAGYDPGQMRRILAWAGVPVRRSISRPGKSRTGRRFHVVETVLCDEALARWHATEPVETAARRVGLTGDCLRRLLRRAGLIPPKQSRRLHIRVTDEQVQAALAAHRGRGAP